MNASSKNHANLLIFGLKKLIQVKVRVVQKMSLNPKGKGINFGGMTRPILMSGTAFCLQFCDSFRKIENHQPDQVSIVLR